MDAFSEVLSAVKLRGALYFTAHFKAPWANAVPGAREMAAMLAPGAEHLIIFHLLVEGTARVSLRDGQTETVRDGDVVVFPHGDPHEFTSGPGAPPLDERSIIRKVLARDLSPMEAGGNGATAKFVCGFMICDPLLSAPILEGLPRLLKVNVRTDRAGHWLESSLLHLVEESLAHHAGSDAMLAKVSEALFVDTLRRHVAGLPDQQVGWLAGARDPLVGKSLALLHSRVSHPWTIAELAEEVGASRSALVERFSRYLGEPPIAYLTRWRLQLAAQSLLSTTRGIADISADIGYESEAAFNRAFKRTYGIPPARFRRERKGTPSVEAVRPAAAVSA